MTRKLIAWLMVLTLGLSSMVLTGAAASDSGVDVSAFTWEDADRNTQTESGAVQITLADGASSAGNAAGVQIDGDIITITQGGTYVLTGTLSDGQVAVNAGKKIVHLIFKQADISSSTSAPLYIPKAKKVILTLEGGTVNRLHDETSSLDDEGDEISAALFSRADLVINGEGTLTVEANANDGITSKDTLKIAGGTLNVNAVDDGIVGKDCVMIDGGNLQVTSSGDGIKSTSTGAGEGYVYVSGGTLNIVSDNDGMQSETGVRIEGGTLSITTCGGSAAAEPRTEQFMRGGFDQAETEDESTVSTKGIKSPHIDISGGVVTLDNLDDSLHADDMLYISGGTINISSGDDAMHSDGAILITGGDILISQSYEGLEAASIEITGGHVDITASDDGINGSGGMDGSGESSPMGRDRFDADTGESIVISGGDVTVSAQGDGIDANGSLHISGGTLQVNGPESGGNGIFDANGDFVVSGGTVWGIGNSGMMVTPSQSSSQNTITVSGASYAGKSQIEIRDASGTVLGTSIAVKSFSTVIFSGADIQLGQTYSVYVNGELMGSVEALQSANSSDFGGGSMPPGGRGGGGEFDGNFDGAQGRP